VNLAARLKGRVTVLGIGNPLRGDDGVGCRIARDLAVASRSGALATRAGLTIVDAEDVPENYVGVVAAARPDVVLMVDAADLGAEPGASMLVEAADMSGVRAVTHRTSLGITAAVIRQRTGADVLLLAVQPAALEWGAPLSPSVASAVESVSALLQEALSC
jgi:hydrogenase 3 maturation protease